MCLIVQILGYFAPVVCPAGFVCQELGLVGPRHSCPRGHFCPEGVKTSHHVGVSNSSEAFQWVTIPESGIAYFNASARSSQFEEFGRPEPATGQRRREHAPNRAVFAEQPIPCPLGYYCGQGVAIENPVPKNFSTPQRCFDGFSVREDLRPRKVLALVPLDTSVLPHLKRWHARRVSFALVLPILSLETVCRAHTTRSRPSPTALSVKAVGFARDGLAFSRKSVRQALCALDRVCPRLFCSVLQDTSAAKVLLLRTPQILSRSVPYRAHLARFVSAGLRTT